MSAAWRLVASSVPLALAVVRNVDQCHGASDLAPGDVRINKTL